MQHYALLAATKQVAKWQHKTTQNARCKPMEVLSLPCQPVPLSSSDAELKAIARSSAATPHFMFTTYNIQSTIHTFITP
jgi:hypothetical protein